MRNCYRVNPANAPEMEFLDSRQPELHSLKFKLFSRVADWPTPLLMSVKGAYSEGMLERIRHTHYSERPSRLRSIFVFENLGEAKKFQNSGWTERDGLIRAYKVNKLYAPPFVADMCLTNVLGNLREKWEEFKTKRACFIQPTLEQSLEYICHAYWQGRTSMDLGLGGNNHIKEVLLDAYIEPLPFVPLT